MITSVKRRSRRFVFVAKWSAIGSTILVAVAVTAMVALRFVTAAGGPDTVFDTSNRVLIGQLDFDGPMGAAPDPRFFDYDVGTGYDPVSGTGVLGWGNGEQQRYTRDRINSRLSGDGNLIIEAHRDGDRFTSARLVTRGRVDFGYGLLEARIRMPEGEGIHPAFWLLGANIKEVGYPMSGEIDVIELVNTGNDFHNALHGPQIDHSTEAWKLSSDGESDTNLAQDYHIFQLYREEGLIVVGIDGRRVGMYERGDLPAGARWVFDGPMYAVLNIAVGGEWPGPVAPSTQFPARMLVDWIRYWQ